MNKQINFDTVNATNLFNYPTKTIDSSISPW